MSRNKAILTRLGNNETIRKPLETLLYKTEKLNSGQCEYLLSVALTLIQEFEESFKNENEDTLLIDYAYFIISKVSYKSESKDYRALFDFSVNYGYYPVAKKIIDLHLIPDLNIQHFMSLIAIEEFTDNDKVKTLEQNNVFTNVLNDTNSKIGFIAPTSYGKSELIFEHLLKNDDKNFVGIIVPTKALIDQVYRDAKKTIFNRKLIIHDQSYVPSVDTRILAVVTQERALRLVDEGLKFDILYIDEAHLMLDFNYKYGFDNRSLLLTRLISIARQQNPDLQELYLSPVLNSSTSLEIKGQELVSNHKIANNLKLLEINYLNLEKKNYIYDRFLNHFVEISSYRSVSDYIRKKSKNKNLHFLYRPKYIEAYANNLSEILTQPDELPTEIQELVEELEIVVHPRFKLIRYLKRGIIYLHGRMPQTIKNYLLKYVRESKFIKHFVANSVVLAGMNLPIDNLFYISGNADIKDLLNLIGRVNRLNEIFSSKNNDIARLFVPVHFIEHKDYPQHRGGKLTTKIEKLRTKPKDTIKNPLLKKSEIGQKNEIKAQNINYVESILINRYDEPEFKDNLLRAGGQQLMNYSEKGLNRLNERIKRFKSPIDQEDIMETIKRLFFDDFGDDDFKPDFNVSRLNNNEAINYYTRFIDDLNKYTLHDRIEQLVKYWKERRWWGNSYVYVGSQFGEVSRPTSNYPAENSNPVYVDLKSHMEDTDFLFNLAIIKLQTDEDFVSHEIMLLLNTMKMFEIITQEEFDKLIYGTDNLDDINILRLGVPRSLYRKMKNDKVTEHIVFDTFGNARADNILKEYINRQKGIVKFQLEEYFT